MIDYRLYLVTDDPSRYAGDWVENVVAAVQGGVTCVQYRDTENTREQQYVRIMLLKDALKAYKTPIIVNNDAELAAAVKAEGVHVGQNDMPVEQVRKIVGENCEIGLSITEFSQLQASNVGIADCLGIGPVFDARKTKVNASAAMGVDGLRAILNAKLQTLNSKLQAPNPKLASVAIGGITLENAAEVYATGVGGIAVVSAFSKAKDPYSVAKAFMRIANSSAAGCA